MIKAAIISLGSTSSKWTFEAMKKYFDEVENIDLREIEINLGAKKDPVLYRGKPLPRFDCVFAKGSFRYSPVLRSIVSLLPKDTYSPITYSSFTLGHDKLLTHQILQVAGIPMPLTYIATTSEAAKKILQNMKYPVVMKFPQGTQGKGVMIAESFASANSLLDALNVLNQPFIIQEYIETDGSDIRAFVVGDKVVAAMKRKAVQGEKRANIHAGGIGEAFELDNYTKKVAIETAKVMGAEICGVDILESASGPKVIEINLSPSLQGISSTTKVNIADKIARYLYEKTKDMLKGQKGNTKKILQNEGISDMNSSKEIITTLDMRGERILLPEVVTKMTKFGEKKEMVIKASKKELLIKEFRI